MKIFFLCLVCVSLMGCTNFRKLSVIEVPSPTETSTKITSNPPGARIEIGGKYVGDAPLHVEIDAPLYVNGTVNKNLYVEAIPDKPEQYKQTINLYERKVPRIISFNMNLAPTPKSAGTRRRTNTMQITY